MTNYDLSIIIPVYNERTRLDIGLPAILEYMDRTDLAVELVMVDDGSLDDTVAQIESRIEGRENARLLRLQRNRGKGAAVKVGMIEAAGEIRLFSDIDLSVPIEVADDFVALFDEAVDIVIGTRKITTSNVEVHQPRYREMLGEVFRQTTMSLFTPGLSDITCGFKAFRAEAAERVFTPSIIERWSFDAEILFLALRYGMRVKEVPVTWRNNPETKVRLAVDLPRSLIELIRIRWHWAVGGYPRS